MIFLKFVLFAIWVTIIPFGIGLNYNRWHARERMFSWLEVYLCGLMTELVLFQILAICLTFLKSTLSLLTALWLVGCGILLFSGVLTEVFRKKFFRRKSSIELEDKECQNVADSRRNFKDKTVERQITGRKHHKLNWENRIVAVTVAALVLFQVVFVTLHVHDDLDDSWYVGSAVVSYFTDTLNRISPYSMEILPHFSMDYVLSPWPIFCAMLGRLTFTHPAIIMHTYVPILMIPLAYAVYWLLARAVFGQKKNRAIWLLFFLCVLNIFGNWSIRSTSTFLLFRIWQGKAILCNIIIPLMLYLFIRLADAQEKKGLAATALLITLTAGTMVSSMGVFLGPAMLFVLSVVDAVSHRRLKNGLIAVVCIIPCVIQFGIYLWMRY